MVSGRKVVVVGGAADEPLFPRRTGKKAARAAARRHGSRMHSGAPAGTTEKRG